jgi:chromosome condensin MukBEF MukE localization factor
MARRRLRRFTLDNIAFWLSGGSLLVAFASLVVALMAKQQARQAALLMSRTEAIAHVRQALGNLKRNGLATAKTMDSIQKALDLSHLLFGKEVRKDVEQAYSSARLVQEGQDMENGIVTLKEDLSKLIAQMNEEAALVRVPQERPH